jgi:hypothetical protein
MADRGKGEAMQNLQLLNNNIHEGIRLRTATPGSVPLVRIIVDEIVTAATSCPIFFSKNAQSGAFYIGALMGFRPGELLLDMTDTKAAFIPQEIEREGFFASGENIAIDVAHSRFMTGEGHRLFDEGGLPTLALRRAQAALTRLMAGSAPTEAFIASILSHHLIEPIDISLNFDDGERLRLDGLYTVSLDALSELDDATALALFRSGHMHLAYAIAASLPHIGLYARRRNERLAQAA